MFDFARSPQCLHTGVSGSIRRTVIEKPIHSDDLRDLLVLPVHAGRPAHRKA